MGKRRRSNGFSFFEEEKDSQIGTSKAFTIVQR